MNACRMTTGDSRRNDALTAGLQEDVQYQMSYHMHGCFTEYSYMLRFRFMLKASGIASRLHAIAALQRIVDSKSLESALHPVTKPLKTAAGLAPRDLRTYLGYFMGSVLAGPYYH